MQEVSKQRSSSQQILADDLMLYSQDWNMAELSRIDKPPSENKEKHDMQAFEYKHDLLFVLCR